ncbi:hypothetical protein [Pontiella sulfatireligans]|uniref:Uncharacterized protein n=1 Tax=Pontiella sulfatireligans TaxID=2750658 RepID=A0A6C2UTM3_9BACT|nr:hypothetical protein [Pontiella sulfatireligans]VGO22584.1 hypothetical protein SCARR_04669 [Pontiella sulfatireligans]
MAQNNMELSIIQHRVAAIMDAVIGNPLVYMPLIGAWFITETYFIVNSDEAHGHTYVMSTGIALIFTAYMISPFAVKHLAWSLLELRTFVVMVLFLYGVFLVLFGILKQFPDLLAEFFGDPGHALVPSMMGILYIEHNIAFDWVTFAVIATPVIILSVIKIFRRLVYRISNYRTKKEEA